MTRPEDTANVALPDDGETEAARAVIAKVTESELHDAIRTLARRDPAWWRTELARMARIEGRADILGGHK